MRYSIANIAMIFFLFFFGGSAQAVESGVVSFDMPAKMTAEAGYVRLVWKNNSGVGERDNTPYQLQQASYPDFRDAVEIYHGPDRASFLSGLPEGNHYFRVRVNDEGRGGQGLWSDTILVEVRYQSMTLAWALLVTGAAVFLCTIMVILRGSSKPA